MDMEKNDLINNFPKKILHYKTFFQNNIFDDDFLDEKDKALSPIVLSDEIPGEKIKNHKKKKKKKITNFNSNEEKYIRYGSNVVYIDAQKDKNDNNDEFRAIINDKIFKILNDENMSSENL